MKRVKMDVEPVRMSSVQVADWNDATVKQYFVTANDEQMHSNDFGCT